MKTFNFATLALAAICCVSYAQQPADAGKLTAIVQINKDQKKPALIALEGAEGDEFQFSNNGTLMKAKGSDCLVFLIQTPPELVEGTKLQAAREFKKARAKLSACKTKYAKYASLPGNPSRQAALQELQCAVSMLDWPALKGLTTSFPAKKSIDKTQINDVFTVAAAQVLANITDNLSAEDGKKLVESAEELLKKNQMKQVDGRVYGWLKYALARGLAAQVPAAEIKDRSISAASKEVACKAADAFCEAAISPHGSDIDVSIDALKRAQAILWALPEVKAYADSHPGKMDAKNWGKAPSDFKDAVAIAYILLNVYNAGKDDQLEKAASFFFNAQAGKGKK